MPDKAILKGKKILVVDDEQDILQTLKEELDMCVVDSAPDFEAARKFLDRYDYDAAILDIMGVRGYDLLSITAEKGIPTLMLTAHALSPENLVTSIKQGAQSYVPKEKMSEIATFLADVLEARERGINKHGNWFARLKPFFDKKFGADWREKEREFWMDFDKNYIVTKKELEEIM
jgi:DNA-binding NtrC family response regulator